VSRGQPLVTLSAMKMEIVCDSPVNGIVEAIGCMVNELVEADQELVTMRVESAEGEPAEVESSTIP
jgi:biotin carboxyl carrier protein